MNTAQEQVAALERIAKALESILAMMEKGGDDWNANKAHTLRHTVQAAAVGHKLPVRMEQQVMVVTAVRV